MTETSFPHSPTLRGWFHDACRLFAAKAPTPGVNGSSGSAAPRRTATEPATCIAVAGSQASRGIAVPDAARCHAGVDIAAEDWDLLFRAALEQLVCVAAEKPMQSGTGRQLQAPGTALRECLAALDQLRRSVHPE